MDITITKSRVVAGFRSESDLLAETVKVESEKSV
jgi:hypothetical protein